MSATTEINSIYMYIM